MRLTTQRPGWFSSTPQERAYPRIRALTRAERWALFWRHHRIAKRYAGWVYALRIAWKFARAAR